MKKITTLLIILFCFSPLIFAIEDTKKITIEEAISVALENNIDLQASKIDTQIKKNEIKISNKLKNPGLGVFYNMGKAGKDNPQQIGITQTIELGKRGARKELAKSKYNLAQRNEEYSKFDLRMDVREAYTNLLAKKSVYTTMKEQQEFLEAMLIQAQNLYKKRKTDEIDVLQAHLLLNQIITQVNAAEYEVKSALYDFNKVINAKEGFYDTIENDFTEDYKPLMVPELNENMPPFDTIAKQAINDRYDIKIALQEIDVAEKNLKVIIRKKIPDIDIQGGYSYQNPGQTVERDNKFKNGAYVGANIVNIPIFNSYSPEIKNARLKLEKAKLNYISTENKALNDLEKAYNKFLLSKITLKNYNDKLIGDSEKLINASRKSYKNGNINLTTLITMEESYRMIDIAHTYAVMDYYNAWNEFIRQVNNEDFILNDNL